jgi:hypothetical protein
MDPETEFFRHNILFAKTYSSIVLYFIKRRRLLQFLSKLIRFDARILLLLLAFDSPGREGALFLHCPFQPMTYAPAFAR